MSFLFVSENVLSTSHIMKVLWPVDGIRRLVTLWPWTLGGQHRSLPGDYVNDQINLHREVVENELAYIEAWRAALLSHSCSLLQVSHRTDQPVLGRVTTPIWVVIFAICLCRPSNSQLSSLFPPPKRVHPQPTVRLFNLFNTLMQSGRLSTSKYPP